MGSGENLIDVKLRNIPRRTVEEIDREIAPLQHRLSELLTERAAAVKADEPTIVQLVRRFYQAHPPRLPRRELAQAMARGGYMMPLPPRKLSGRYDDFGRLSAAIGRELSPNVRGRKGPNAAPPRLKLDRQGCVIPADWEK